MTDNSNIRNKVRFYAKQGRSRNDIFDALTQPKKDINGKVHRNKVISRKEVQQIVQSVPLSERQQARRLYIASRQDKVKEIQDNFGFTRKEALALVRAASKEALLYRHDPSRKETFELAMKAIDSDLRRRGNSHESPKATTILQLPSGATGSNQSTSQ